MTVGRPTSLPDLLRGRPFGIGPPLVVAITLVIGPSVARAAPPSSPQSAERSPADDIREAAQRVTKLYMEDAERARAFEAEGRRQAGMSLTEQREQSVRHSMAWRVAQRGRPELIQTLDQLADTAPEDDWTVGHRVGFRILHGLYGDALRVAQSCRASRWWCAQLTGLALQILGEFAAADSAFAVALKEAPGEHECEMRDISALLDRETASRYVAMGCEERKVVEERFWWLAAPLHVQPVNDRRTEHWARVTALRLHDQLLHRIDMSCPEWHWEHVLRNGWPEHWWSRSDPFGSSRHVPGLAFAPHTDALARALADPLGIATEDWDFDPEAPGASGERYDHPNGPVYEVENQVAFFRRGDSAVVVAAIDFRGNPLLLRGALDASLVLARDQHDQGITRRESGAELRYVFRARVPAERHLVSLEVVAERGGFGRARFADGLPEPGSGGLALSSLLMFEGAVPVDEDLDSVYSRALGTTHVPSGESVGLYWEVYGLGAGDGLEFELRVRREEGRGFFRRLGEALRLVDSVESSNTLRWQEPPETDGFLSRVLDLDISNLAPGRYTIELEAHSGSRGTAVARRPFEVVSPGS